MENNRLKLELDCGNVFDYVYKLPHQKDRMLAMKNETIGFLAAMERQRLLDSVQTSIDFILNGKGSEYVTFNEPRVRVGTQETNDASSSSSTSSNSPSEVSSNTSVDEEEVQEEREAEILDEMLCRQYISTELMQTIEMEENAAEGVTVRKENKLKYWFLLQFFKKYVRKE